MRQPLGGLARAWDDSHALKYEKADYVGPLDSRTLDTPHRVMTMGRLCLPSSLLVLNLALAWWPAAAQQSRQAGPDTAWWARSKTEVNVSAPEYDSVTRRSRYLTMRDGVRIAIDLYLPTALDSSTKLPTLLEQTRYYRSEEPAPGHHRPGTLVGRILEPSRVRRRRGRRSRHRCLVRHPAVGRRHERSA